MTARPSVAVVVTSYNYERYLEATLDSALTQDDPPDQLVVVDDGSSDRSPVLLEHYRDRATVLLQSNAGQGAAWNAGWAQVTSDVVVFVDPDDLLRPHAVRSIRSAWRSDLSKLHWQMTVVDAEGRDTGELLPAAPPPAGLLRDQLVREGPAPLVFSFPPTSGNAWSAELLRSVMPLEVDLWRVCPDTPLLTAALLEGRIGRHPEPLSAYRIHGNNESWRVSGYEKTLSDLGLLRESARMIRTASPDTVTDRLCEEWVEGSWAGRIVALRELVQAEVPHDEPFVLLDHW